MKVEIYISSSFFKKIHSIKIKNEDDRDAYESMALTNYKQEIRDLFTGSEALDINYFLENDKEFESYEWWYEESVSKAKSELGVWAPVPNNVRTGDSNVDAYLNLFKTPQEPIKIPDKLNFDESIFKRNSFFKMFFIDSDGLICGKSFNEIQSFGHLIFDLNKFSQDLKQREIKSATGFKESTFVNFVNEWNNNSSNTLRICERWIFENAMNGGYDPVKKVYFFSKEKLKASIKSLYFIFFRNTNRNVSIEIKILGVLIQNYVNYEIYHKGNSSILISGLKEPFEPCKNGEERLPHNEYSQLQIIHEFLNEFEELLTQVFIENGLPRTKYEITYVPTGRLCYNGQLNQKYVKEFWDELHTARYLVSNSVCFKYDKNPFYMKGEKEYTIYLSPTDIIRNFLKNQQWLQKGHSLLNNRYVPQDYKDDDTQILPSYLVRSNI